MKKVLKAIWDEFIYGGHFHSIGVSCLIYSVSITIGKPAPISLLVIIYAGIHSGYLFNRYKEYEIDEKSNPNRTKHIGKYNDKIPAIICSLVVLMIILLILYGNLKSIVFSFCIFLIGILYSIIVKKYTNKIIGLKNYFVALSFASLLFLYSLYTNSIIGTSLLIMFVVIALRVFSNTIFFDLKDIESDKKEKLKTFPVFLGINNSYTFLNFINVISLVPVIIGVILGFLPIYSLSLVLLIPFVLFYLDLSHKKPSVLPTISYLYADGEYILWLLLILVFKFSWNKV
jgi:4-hydroxybenzoate polyprenyltransferase